MATAESRLLAVVRTAPGEGREALLLQAADGQLWADAATFAGWNVPPPAASRDAHESRWHPLHAVAGLRYRFDHCTQELWLDGAQVVRDPYRASAAPPPAAAPARLTESGGFLNLDMQALRLDPQRQLAGQMELGIFAGPGFALSTALHDGEHMVRLENSLTLDWPARRERLRLGDSITRSQVLGRSVRFGGVQWGTDFSLQPDLVTFPMPGVRGTARLPSAAEIYVDQSLQARADVPAGPFELAEVPVVSGAGELQLVLRDALGRSQVVAYPFYASPALLRDGLSDYSAQLGWLRQDFGLSSAAYSGGFAAATWRHGVSDRLTVELRADGGAAQRTVGGAVSTAAPRWGAWTAGAAVSEAAAGTGVLGVLVHEYRTTRWHYGAEARVGSEHFVQLGDPVGDLRRSLALRFGFNTHGYGALSAFSLDHERRGEAALRVVGLNHSWTPRRAWFANLAFTHSLTDRAEQAVMLTFSHQWDARTAAILEHDQRHYDDTAEPRLQSRASVHRSAPGAVGVGYRAYTEDGPLARHGASASWGGARGAATGEIEQFGEQHGVRLGYATGIAVLGSDFFWTRPVTGSFAVVDTGVVPGVRVYADNRPVGRTNADGVLLVPDLRAFEANQLRIDETDVPIHFELPRLGADVRPPARSGVRLDLAARPPQALAVRLRRDDGSAPPAGARLLVDGVAAALPLGYDGVAVIDVAQGPRVLSLQWSDGACRARLDAAATTGAMRTLACSEDTQ